MKLNCTLVGAPESALFRPPVELSIDAPAVTEGLVIHEQLVQKFSAGVVTVDGEDLRSLVLGVPPF